MKNSKSKVSFFIVFVFESIDIYSVKKVTLLIFLVGMISTEEN